MAGEAVEVVFGEAGGEADAGVAAGILALGDDEEVERIELRGRDEAGTPAVDEAQLGPSLAAALGGGAGPGAGNCCQTRQRQRP